jgi:hypothetical protein
MKMFFFIKINRLAEIQFFGVSGKGKILPEFSYQNSPPPSIGRLQALPKNIRPRWQALQGANALAYLLRASVTKKKKCFIKLTPGPTGDCPTLAQFYKTFYSRNFKFFIVS